MNRKRRDIIASSQVSRMAAYTLAGYPQKVLLDGKLEASPILLCLHGGPGMPIPYGAGCRGLFPELTEHFIMVYWDQYGCGKNNARLDNHLTIDSFVDMTVGLIQSLKADFPNNKLYIFGTSWGSVLAARAAAILPHLIDSVLIYGQVLSHLFFNEEVYEALNGASLSSKDRQRVLAMAKAEVHTREDIQLIGKLIRKHTEGYQAKVGGKLPLGPMLRGILTSPDYSLKDIVATVKNGYAKNTSLWGELVCLDLRDTLRQVQIPYRILQGSTDIVTSTKSMASFVEESGNHNLTLRVIANNGHMPGASGMEETLAAFMELIE